MAQRRKPTAKQRAAQKAWSERQRHKKAWTRGEEGSGAVPLDGETSWSLAPKPGGAFEHVAEDMVAVRGVTVGHCYPPAADGAPAWPIVVDADGNWSQIEPD